jgi:hypothetical protein
MTTPAQVRSPADPLEQPSGESPALGPANVARSALGAPKGTSLTVLILRHPVQSIIFAATARNFDH